MRILDAHDIMNSGATPLDVSKQQAGVVSEEHTNYEMFEKSVTLAWLMLLLRKQAGWTQNELAETVGVDQSLISRIESGETKQPRRQTLLRFVEAFNDAGISVDLSQLEAASHRPPSGSSDQIDERLVHVHETISMYPQEVRDRFYDAVLGLLRVFQITLSADSDE